jgi:hypothetical protein
VTRSVNGLPVDEKRKGKANSDTHRREVEAIIAAYGIDSTRQSYQKPTR